MYLLSIKDKVSIIINIPIIYQLLRFITYSKFPSIGSFYVINPAYKLLLIIRSTHSNSLQFLKKLETISCNRCSKDIWMIHKTLELGTFHIPRVSINNNPLPRAERKSSLPAP